MFKITENLIRLNVDIKNWEEIIKFGGKILEEEDIATKSYSESIIEVTKKLGPYYVITKHIAMPHARPEDGVIQSGICFISLKNGVNFGSENDPVKYIFLIAMKDNNSHIEFIQFLSELIENKKFYEAVNLAKSKKEVINFFK